jgi:hypothetical protein
MIINGRLSKRVDPVHGNEIAVVFTRMVLKTIGDLEETAELPQGEGYAEKLPE